MQQHTESYAFTLEKALNISSITDIRASIFTSEYVREEKKSKTRWILSAFGEVSQHVVIWLRNSVQKHYQAGRGYTPGFNKNCLSPTMWKYEVESCLPGEGERCRGADLCFHKHNFT